jgi:hypothetical protein
MNKDNRLAVLFNDDNAARAALTLISLKFVQRASDSAFLLGFRFFAKLTVVVQEYDPVRHSASPIAASALPDSPRWLFLSRETLVAPRPAENNVERPSPMR